MRLLPPSLPRKHLSVRRFHWWARFISINTFLFFLFFFLTTPAIIINTIDMYNVTRPLEKLQVLLCSGQGGALGRGRKPSDEDGMRGPWGHNSRARAPPTWWRWQQCKWWGGVSFVLKGMNAGLCPS